MARKHSEICQDCSEAAEREGWLAISYPSNAYTGQGTSDRIICPAPYVYFVEVKTPENPDQTDAQKAFQRRCERRGHKYFVIFSAEEMLKKIKWDLIVKEGEARGEL